MNTITLEDIAKIVCEQTLLEERLLRKKTNLSHIVYARQLIVYFARNFTKKSYYELGVFLGKKHYSTMISCYKRIKEFLDIKDQKVLYDISEIIKRINTLNKFPDNIIMENLIFLLRKCPSYSFNGCTNFFELANYIEANKN